MQSVMLRTRTHPYKNSQDNIKNSRLKCMYRNTRNCAPILHFTLYTDQLYTHLQSQIVLEICNVCVKQEAPLPRRARRVRRA